MNYPTYQCLHRADPEDYSTQCGKPINACPGHEEEEERIRRLPDKELLDLLRDYGLYPPDSKETRLARAARGEVLRRMGQRS